MSVQKGFSLFDCLSQARRDSVPRSRLGSAVFYLCISFHKRPLLLVCLEALRDHKTVSLKLGYTTQKWRKSRESDRHETQAHCDEPFKVALTLVIDIYWPAKRLSIERSGPVK